MPQVAAPTAALQFSLDFNAKTHQFVVKIPDVNSLEYTIEYTTQPEPVTHALTGQVTADITRQITLELLAGTESDLNQTLHQVKDGVLKLTAQTTSGQSVEVTQFFTINAQQKLQLAEFTQHITAGEVLGESITATPTATLTSVGMPSDTIQDSLKPEALTATPTTSSSLAPLLSWVLIGSILISAVSASTLVWLRRRSGTSR